MHTRPATPAPTVVDDAPEALPTWLSVNAPYTLTLRFTITDHDSTEPRPANMFGTLDTMPDRGPILAAAADLIDALTGGHVAAVDIHAFTVRPR